jgi:hypothetical protein
MISIIKKLLASRKAVMTALGVLTGLIAPILNTRFGLNLSEEQMTQALYPFIAYIIGQGVADYGKEKTTLETDAWAERAYAAEAELSALKHKKTAGDIADAAEKHARNYNPG